MARTLDQIIANADAFAELFEGAEPEDLRPVDPLDKLRLAAMRRGLLEKEILEVVRDARGSSATWDQIGEAVGTTGEAARKRYSHYV